MKRLIPLLCMVVFTGFAAIAGEYSLRGVVLDADNGTPLAGSAVRVLGANRGAYASRNGVFKVTIHDGDEKIKISSIGYEPAVVALSSLRRDGSATIKLKPTAVVSAGVVVHSLLPEDIVRKAIEKREENKSKKKTLTAVVYSKTNVEMSDETAKMITGVGSNGLTASLGSPDEKKKMEESKYIIMETFSNYFCDYEKPLYYSEIVQRRQTKNIPAENNILSLTRFIDLSADEINLIGTRMITPVGANATSYYDYSFAESTSDNGRKVYVIDFKPNSELFPGFVGRLMIIDSTFDIIMLRMRPSDATAINFIKNLRFEQRFKEAERNLWVPDFLETEATIDVNVIKGMLDFGLNFKIMTVLNDIKINIPLPDSLYKYAGLDDVKSVAPKADSARPEFWEMNALSELSAEEKTIYAKVDTAVVVNDSLRKADSTESRSGWMSWLKFDPYLDFNRVGSISVGLSKDIRYSFVTLTPTYYYSFGQQRSFGEGELKLNLGNWEHRLMLKGSLFSKIASTGNEEPYPRIMNSISAGLFHSDYYDYMRSDGFSAGIEAGVRRISLRAYYTESRNMSLEKKTNRSAFDDSRWRDNPQIDDGAFRSVQASIEFGNTLMSIASSDFDYYLLLGGSYTQPISYNSHRATDRYRSAYGQLSLNLPLLYTGYNPISLRLSVAGGIQDSTVAVQDMFRMRTNLVFVSNNPAFYSAPYSKFGGNKFWLAQADLNLSDILWRAVGLPLFEGRGPELYLTAASAKFEQELKSVYTSTGNDYYSELGFGFRRIPTFISNVIFWDFSARWGVGALASGNFGCAINVSFPF